MKTLFVGLRHDYGDKTRGDSFEYETFVPALARVSDEVIVFPFDVILHANDYFEMNHRLIEVVNRHQPDLVFCVLFENQLDRAAMLHITDGNGPRTFNWFCDDHWRYRDFSRHWMGCFHAVSTTSADAFRHYKMDAFDSVIKTQWAVDESRIRRAEVSPSRQTTFVGQMRKSRALAVDALRKDGQRVDAFGTGWPAGRLSVSDMINVQHESMINLNFADSQRLRPWRRRLTQVKARPFELGAAGRAVVSEYDVELDEYYTPGVDLMTFSTKGELVEIVRRMSSDVALCKQLGDRIRERTMNEHTYTHRLTSVFSAIGLKPAVHAGLRSPVRFVDPRRGSTELTDVEEPQ